MENLINKTSLENILMKNWPDFIDKNRLIAFTLKNIRDSNLKKTKESNIVIGKNISITTSRFEITSKGFLIWIEFSIPMSQNSIAKGTTELEISHTGKLYHSNTIGEILSNNVN